MAFAFGKAALPEKTACCHFVSGPRLLGWGSEWVAKTEKLSQV